MDEPATPAAAPENDDFTGLEGFKCEVTSDERANETDRWMRYFCRHSRVLSYDQMKVVWPELKRVMLRRLTYERVAIDFGFCKLVPLPYRSNWKEIVIVKAPWLLKLVQNKVARKLRRAFMIAAGMPELLRHSDMIAVRHRGQDMEKRNHWHAELPTVVWRLEIVESDSWKTFSTKVEQKKRGYSTATEYAARWLKDVEKSYAYAVSALMDAITQERYPCADHAKLRPGSDLELVPHIPEGKLRPLPAPNHPISSVVRDHICPKIETTQDSSALTCPPAAMLEMPDVQPDADDVRNPWGDVVLRRGATD